MAVKRPAFRGGVNIAMKIPPHQFEETKRFYVETLGLSVLGRTEDSVELGFGPNRLWLDRVPWMSQAEIWLEVTTDDVQAAAVHLRDAGVPRRDEIEPLGEEVNGYWISSPSQIIHLVLQEGPTEAR